MVAQRKIDTVHRTSPAVATPAWESMADPLHPMHQELLRRMTPASGVASSIGHDTLGRPARFAAIFYLGLAAWAVPAAAIYVAHLVL